MVEMLLVLVILATLAAIVVPKFTGRSEQAKQTAAQTQIANLSTALDAFEVDNGYYPKGSDGLTELLEQPKDAKNWRGPYMKQGIPKDPWGNPYVLQIPPNEAFESATEERRFHYARLVSAGPDGVLQTPCLKGMDYLAFHDNPPSDPDAEPPPAPLWAALDGAGIADYRRALRLAGRVASGDPSNRGDDLVLFLNRPDIYERDE
jgi:general secretion pathway protein G